MNYFTTYVRIQKYKGKSINLALMLLPPGQFCLILFFWSISPYVFNISVNWILPLPVLTTHPNIYVFYLIIPCYHFNPPPVNIKNEKNSALILICDLNPLHLLHLAKLKNFFFPFFIFTGGIEMVTLKTRAKKQVYLNGWIVNLDNK